MIPRRRLRSMARVLLLATLGASCAEAPGEDEPTVAFTVPPGASFQEVTDTLEGRDLVGFPGLFELYARMKGADRGLKAGGYVLAEDASWSDVLDALTRGAVTTERLTIPEGFRIAQMAPRIAEISGVSEDSVHALLESPELQTRLAVPGPELEGYLFPDTYLFAPGVSPVRIVEAMVNRYEAVWTPERRSSLDSLGMSERELVTLASIIQAEARRVREMPDISSVYHNRLREAWPLQADPTVLYALGGPRERLLYAAIDSVKDDPYNTYTHPGLPPGPIGAPGARALEAALHPSGEPYFYFVARPDGSHVFSRTLAEHNRAKAISRRMLDSLTRMGAGEA